MKHIISCTTILLLALLTLNACGPPQPWTPPKTKPATTTATLTSTEPSRSPSQQAATAREQIRPLLAAKDYAAVIRKIREEIERGLPEQALVEYYLSALNGSLQQAEDLQTEEDYAGAGRLYRTVQENIQQSPRLAAKLARSQDQILLSIDTCAERLMEKGLVAYRSGLLKTAIKFWKQILAFQPGHKAAQRAIETTELQQANLMRLGTNL